MLFVLLLVNRCKLSYFLSVLDALSVQTLYIFDMAAVASGSFCKLEFILKANLSCLRADHVFFGPHKCTDYYTDRVACAALPSTIFLCINWPGRCPSRDGALSHSVSDRAPGPPLPASRKFQNLPDNGRQGLG